MTYGYDNADRLTSLTDWNANAVTYAYDDAGRLTIRTLPSGTAVVSSYTYDNADRLTAISHVKNGSTTLASVSYTLNAMGNRTQRVDQQGTHTYAYDNVHRLTSVTYPGPSTTTYAYDAFGNRTSMTKPGSQTTTYAYNDGDRMTSVTPPGKSAVSYTWDNNGNLTNRGSDTFAWDYEDRVTSATVEGTATTFAYRGDDLRESRTVGGNTTTFTWDLNAGLPVVLDDGNQYLYGHGLEAMKQSGSWYYYLEDGLGSTMAIVDSTGTVQKSYTYDVYGKPTPTGTLSNEFDFAGQQTDWTGLQYLRARYMDPEAGVFLSRDPLAVSPAWLSNPYSYVDGNPTNFVDPLGLAGLHPEEQLGTGLSEKGDGVLANCPGVWGGGLADDMGYGDIFGLCGGGTFNTGKTSSIARPRQAGLAFEELAGVAGPKVGIRSALKDAWRFPDLVDRRAGVIREAKSSPYVWYSGQLKDYVAIAKREGYKFELINDAVARGDIVLTRIP